MDQASSYWSLGSLPPLRSTDGSEALVLGVIGGDDDAVEETVGEIADDLAGTSGPLTVEVGCRAEIFRQVGHTIEGDLARAEGIAVPLTLALLIVVFGGLVAALLPVG
ncbi:MAG: MMPL family transporter, partial [Myxococcales bacterium]|nr:MMPL family transporter [Myxococcales bacterium]